MAVDDAVCTLIKVYNKFLIDMVLDLKHHSPALKKALKQHHKAIDPNSDSYIKHAHLSMESHGSKDALVKLQPAGVLQDPRVGAFEPLAGISMAVVTDGLPDASTEAVRNYLYVLSALLVTYAESKDAGAAGSTLANNVLQALSKMQNGENGDDWTDGILDDDIVALLERVPASVDKGGSPGSEGPAAGLNLDDVLQKLENSKIADLAKEISSEIDVSQLPTDNPMEMLNFANLTDSNSVLGNIVSKVGTKIQSRLASGEMKQEELLSEAVTLLKAFDTQNQFGGNPMFSELFKAAQSGRVNLNMGAVKSASARDRLRRKMERQRAEAAAAGKQ
jgi:hypothetical protein